MSSAAFDQANEYFPVICRLSDASSEDLAQIDEESNSPPWSKKLFYQEFSNSCAVFYGARTQGILAGFIGAHVIVDEAHIVKFGVRVAYRSRGIGRAILLYTLRELHASAVKWVTLEVRKSNMIARALYASYGFIEVGERSGYYVDNHEDAVIMSLSVQDFSIRFGIDDFASAANQ